MKTREPVAKGGKTPVPKSEPGVCPTAPDGGYMALIRLHRLKPIRSHEELDAAIKLLNELLIRSDSLTDEEYDYLECLSHEIEYYEEENIPMRRVGPPESIRRLELAGATRAISPYRMAGHRMAELAVRPALVDVFDPVQQGQAEIGVEELMVAPGMAAVGKTIDEVGFLGPSSAKLLALRRRDGTLHVSPTGDMRLEEGDLVIALGSESQLFASAAMLK